MEDCRFCFIGTIEIVQLFQLTMSDFAGNVNRVVYLWHHDMRQMRQVEFSFTCNQVVACCSGYMPMRISFVLHVAWDLGPVDREDFDADENAALPMCWMRSEPSSFPLSMASCGNGVGRQSGDDHQLEGGRRWQKRNQQISRWWFQICFLFTPKLGERWTHFDSYFSMGLKAPTRLDMNGDAIGVDDIDSVFQDIDFLTQKGSPRWRVRIEWNGSSFACFLICFTTSLTLTTCLHPQYFLKTSSPHSARFQQSAKWRRTFPIAFRWRWNVVRRLWWSLDHAIPRDIHRSQLGERCASLAAGSALRTAMEKITGCQWCEWDEPKC